MEAHGVREHPAGTLRGRFVRHALRAAVTDVILPAFAAASSSPRRWPAGRSRATWPGARPCICRRAPTTASSTPPSWTALRHVWRQVLGDQDLHTLDELFSKLIWIPDGELEALDRAAREYRAIIGPPDPPAIRRPRRRERWRSLLPAGAATGPRRARWAKRSSRRWNKRARDSSSSSTPTSTCNRSSPTRQLTQSEAHPSRSRARDRPADRPDARPRRRPTPGARRDPTSPPLRHPAAPGADARHQADRQAHARRAVRRPRLRPRPSATADRTARHHSPVADHPPGHRADPGAARRTRDRHLRLDGRIRVRARTDLLDPHRRPQTDRRTLRHRPVRQQRRAAGRRHAPAAARPRDQDRRRDRVRRRRDRAALPAPRDDQPPPPPLRLCPQRRRLGGHPRRSHADPLARRTRRPHDPPRDRDRAAERGVRPHPRDHRPRPGARPHRRRHRRRRCAPARARDPQHPPRERTRPHAQPQPRAAALARPVRRHHHRQGTRRGHDRA